MVSDVVVSGPWEGLTCGGPGGANVPEVGHFDKQVVRRRGSPPPAAGSGSGPRAPREAPCETRIRSDQSKRIVLPLAVKSSVRSRNM